MEHFIVIAGNIGVGKSTLTEKLAARLRWTPMFEPHANNPYLADFYQNMQQWSFHSQIFFLTERLDHHRKLIEYPGNVIQDRSIYEDAEIFARNLFLQGNMAQRDYEIYQRLYNVTRAMLPAPDLILYLRASVEVLQQRIALRGRDYERDISPDYLAQLSALYDQWAASFSFCPVCTVEAGELNFVTEPAHLEQIVELIDAQLHKQSDY